MKAINIVFLLAALSYIGVCGAADGSQYGALNGALYRNVNVTSVGVQDATIENKYFWVTVSGTPIDHAVYKIPDCHTGPANRLVWSLNNEASKAALSLVLTAYSIGKKIDIDAYGACIDGVATVRNVYFSPGQ